MKLFRICTEKKNLKQVCEIIGTRFSGFTIVEATGYWKGEKEDSLIIEIYTEHKNRHHIEDIAREIVHLNNQESVLIQELDIEGKLI